MANVAVLLGSYNDRRHVVESEMMKVFDAVGIEAPVHVISCHRNAEELDAFCRQADVDVYIASAGMAAALPGALAAATKMGKVVIGVPLDDYGVDTCIRLPGGVPVLTAGVGKAGLRNAAIAACQIAALSDNAVKGRLATYVQEQTSQPKFNISLEDDVQ